MEIFKPINEKKANTKVKRIFNEIKKTRKISKIPNFWKSIAHNPQLLERTWTVSYTHLTLPTKRIV